MINDGLMHLPVPSGVTSSMFDNSVIRVRNPINRGAILHPRLHQPHRCGQKDQTQGGGGEAQRIFQGTKGTKEGNCKKQTRKVESLTKDNAKDGGGPDRE